MHGFRTAHIAVAAISAAFVACDDAAAPPTDFTATLAAVAPATGGGTATFRLVGETIEYDVTFNEFPASPIQAHIHLGGATSAGPIVLNLCGTGEPAPGCPAGTVAGQDDPMGAAGTFYGSITGSADETFLADGYDMALVIGAMRNSGAYVNLHLGTPPGGEVRGSIARSN